MGAVAPACRVKLILDVELPEFAASASMTEAGKKLNDPDVVIPLLLADPVSELYVLKAVVLRPVVVRLVRDPTVALLVVDTVIWPPLAVAAAVLLRTPA